MVEGEAIRATNALVLLLVPGGRRRTEVANTSTIIKEVTLAGAFFKSSVPGLVVVAD